MTGSKQPKPLALTPGEPAGIGPDITITAWLARHREEIPPFLYLGDPELLLRRASALGHSIRAETAAASDAMAAFADVLPCLEGLPSMAATAGTVDQSNAPDIIASIRKGVELVAAGQAGAIVTNPIQKSALDAIGFGFPGHTEFLGSLATELFGKPSTPVMMLASPELRVVPLTVHIALADVPHALTTEAIVDKASIVARDLKARFGIDKPKLAVAGLNPHAGESGMFGTEEEQTIRPAVETLRAAGIDIVGPLAADSMFHLQARAGYDAALCMYHDQALIPFKTLAFDHGVNVTLGLPFVRTSPDHGTALALAGKGKAKASSLIAALRLADALAVREAGD